MSTTIEPVFGTAEALELNRDNVGAVSDDELQAAVLALAEDQRRLDVAAAIVLGELDARGTTDREYGVKTATWVARETSIPAAVAKKKVRVGSMLRRWLPEVDAAMADGRITWDHARVFTEIATPRILPQIVELQATFLELAAGVGFDRWAREVRGLAELLDQDGGHDPNLSLIHI